MESKKENRSVKINRIFGSDKQTLGILTVYDDLNFTFYELRTLELPDKDNQNRISCILAGEYWVEKRWSKKYGSHFILINVFNRTYILIHAANYFRQLLGCIAVGYSHTDIDGDGHRDVTDSVNALKKLNKLLPKRFKLTITDGYKNLG